MIGTVVLATAMTICHPERIRFARTGSKCETLAANFGLSDPGVPTSNADDARFDESVGRPTPSDAELRLSILAALAQERDLDDVEIASRIGVDPFLVSEALRALAAMGLVEAT